MVLPISGGLRVCKTAAFISKSNYKKKASLFGVEASEERKQWMNNSIPDKKNQHCLNTSNTGVSYSLNKDKRWLIREAMRREIECQEYREEMFSEVKNEMKKSDRNAEFERVAMIDQLHFSGHASSNDLKSFVNSFDKSHNRICKSR